MIVVLPYVEESGVAEGIVSRSIDAKGVSQDRVSQHHKDYMILESAYSRRSQRLPSVKAVADRHGISAGTAHTLRTDRAFRAGPKVARALSAAVRQVAAPPYKATPFDEREAALRAALGDDGQKPNIDVVSQSLPLAYYHWPALAREVRIPAGERAFFGLQAQRVLFDVVKLEAFRPLLDDARFFPRAALVEQGLKVCEDLRKLVAGPSAKASLYQGSGVTATDLGFFIVKGRISASWIAWHGCHAAPRVAEKAFRLAIQEGLIEDLEAMAKIIKTEPLWRNNVFNLLTRAAAWQRAAAAAGALFDEFPALLEQEFLGIQPAVEDQTIWPGIAAVVAFPAGPKAEALKRLLMEHKNPQVVRMMGAVDKMIAAVRAGEDYETVSKRGE